MTSAPISSHKTWPKPLQLRPIIKSDRPTIEEWISRDPYHAPGGVSADFYLNPTSILIAVEDKKGPVMFIRIDPETWTQVRVFVQFDINERRRIAVALPRAFAIIRDTVKKAAVTSMVFDSIGPSLIAFCQKRLGFIPADSPGNFIAHF